MAEINFPLKDIYFLGRKTKILCQNENVVEDDYDVDYDDVGPCPLLAIANVMILRNQLNFHPDVVNVSLSEVIQEVGNLFLDSSALNNDNAEVTNVVDDALRILPSLARGLDLNIKFRDVSSFEYTEELTVFDALGINLYHSWIIDDEDAMKHILHDMSYNNLVFKVVNYRSALESDESLLKSSRDNDGVADHLDDVEPGHQLQSSDTIIHEGDRSFTPQSVAQLAPIDPSVTQLAQNESYEIINHHPDSTSSPLIPKSPTTKATLELSASNEDLMTMGSLYEEFLQSNPTQMTYIGLLKLYEAISERQLCILFHNNHFSTLFKYDSKLYLLVTDVGYKDVDVVVWELLDEINGNTVFANSSFQILQEGVDLTPKQSSGSLGLLEVNDRLIGERGIGRYDGIQVEIPVDKTTDTVPAVPYENAIVDHSGTDDADYLLALRLQQEEESEFLENETDANPQVQSRPHPQQNQPTQSIQSNHTSILPRSPQPTANNLDAQAEQQQREYEYYRQKHLENQVKQQQTAGRGSTGRTSVSRPMVARPLSSARPATDNRESRTEKSNNCTIS